MVQRKVMAQRLEGSFTVCYAENNDKTHRTEPYQD